MDIGSGLPPADVPPLENGDRLTREEFHRLYELHPEIDKVELIDGAIESRAFPGLRLDVGALLAGDLAAVLSALS